MARERVKMKIVFVETPSPWLVRRDMHIPLGPLYLATILKREGHDVRLARPETMGDFRFEGVDIICLSGTSLEFPMNEECALRIKLFYPGIKIFLGGSHATAMYKEINHQHSFFDAICVGEGESVIRNMVKDVEKGELNELYFSNGIHGYEDLDAIPFPDRTLIEGDYGNNIFLQPLFVQFLLRILTHQNICHIISLLTYPQFPVSLFYSFQTPFNN